MGALIDFIEGLIEYLEDEQRLDNLSSTLQLDAYKFVLKEILRGGVRK